MSRDRGDNQPPRLDNRKLIDLILDPANEERYQHYCAEMEHNQKTPLSMIGWYRKFGQLIK